MALADKLGLIARQPADGRKGETVLVVVVVVAERKRRAELPRRQRRRRMKAEEDPRIEERDLGKMDNKVNCNHHHFASIFAPLPRHHLVHCTHQTMARAFSERPLDFVYFVFFLVSALPDVGWGLAETEMYVQVHIPASLFVDFQSLYPRERVPSIIAWIPEHYIALSNDPLIAAAFGHTDNAAEYLWFRTFLYLEL
jgi:hypothetical protein